MVWVFALLCGASLSAAECTSSTAIDVIRLPNAGDELACMHASMSTIASLAIKAGRDEYWKFVCIRPQSPEAISLADRTDEETRRDE